MSIEKDGSITTNEPNTTAPSMTATTGTTTGTTSLIYNDPSPSITSSMPDEGTRARLQYYKMHVTAMLSTLFEKLRL